MERFSLFLLTLSLAWVIDRKPAFAAAIDEGVSVGSIRVKASSHDGHSPERALDGNYSDESRWAANGDGQWIMLKLPAAKPLNTLKISFYAGTKRTDFFSVYVSTSASSWSSNTGWTQVLGRQASSGKTNGMQSFRFKETNAQYVKIVGRGNSGGNKWNSFREVQFLKETAPAPTPSAQPSAPPASTPVAGRASPNMIKQIFRLSFENHPTGYYTRARFDQDCNNGKYHNGTGYDAVRRPDGKSLEVVNGSTSADPKKFMRAHIRKGLQQAQTGFDVECEWTKGDGLRPFKEKTMYEEVYQSTNVRFSPGFSCTAGGHWSGGVGAGKVSVGTGVNEDEGWVLDMGLFQASDAVYAEKYFKLSEAQRKAIKDRWDDTNHTEYFTLFDFDIYHLARKSKYADQAVWFDANNNPVFVPTGVWFNLTLRVVMNTPGKRDGIAEGYLNGKLISRKTDLMWRKHDYVGASRTVWQAFQNQVAIKNQYIDFSDWTVFTYADGVNVARGLYANPVGKVIPLPNWPMK